MTAESQPIRPAKIDIFSSVAAVYDRRMLIE
jgi:hypothetical protein